MTDTLTTRDEARHAYLQTKGHGDRHMEGQADRRTLTGSMTAGSPFSPFSPWWRPPSCGQSDRRTDILLVNLEDTLRRRVG